MTKYSGGEGSMNQEQGPSKGVFPSSLENNKGATTLGITTTPPIPEAGRFTDERRISFEPLVGTVPVERPKIWDKEPSKETLLQRLANNLALRLVLAGAGAYGAGYAVNETYQNVPVVRQNTDNVLERFGLKAVVPPTFDNKAEENVLGRNNSFYVTPEEYKEKGPPTVEGDRINVPFFIRFNDGKEHTISVKRRDSANATWDISGDLQGGELLVPIKEDGTIGGGGGNWGLPGIYKPGFSFSRFSSWTISAPDDKGGKISFIITTGALQTSKDLVLQQDGPMPGGKGSVKGFASIGTLLDNQPVNIYSNTITPGNKFKGTYTDIATTPTKQAYVLK